MPVESRKENTHMNHQSFFRFKMMKAYLFPTKPPGLSGYYAPGYSRLNSELEVARQGLHKHRIWKQSTTPDSKHLEEQENINRLENSIGSNRLDTLPFSLVAPFTQPTANMGPALPINPRMGGRWTPRTVRMEWGNLTEDRQE